MYAKGLEPLSNKRSNKETRSLYCSTHFSFVRLSCNRHDKQNNRLNVWWLMTDISPAMIISHNIVVAESYVFAN